ncbi:MAG TPA: zinc ribbon domain-containing protein [Nitrososphaerales archaeon]|nr:zinc ribbon domain-containing protein [Nitrososphaerales archaeon]
MAIYSPAALVLLFLILFTILFFIIYGLIQLLQRTHSRKKSQVALSQISSPVPSDPQPSAQFAVQDSKFCIKCGNKIPPAADFCPDCGNRQ